MSKRGHLSPTRVIVASFFAVILCGALLLMLPVSTRDGSIAFIDALFTATSATCVTGLIVYDTFAKFTGFGQAIIILLIQIGGLGLVTLTTFFNVALRKRMGFKTMLLASESISLEEAAGAKQLLYIVMRTSLGLEMCGALLLMAVMVPQYGAAGIWISVFTAISAFCNAGFDIFGRLSEYTSVTTYAGNWYVLTIIMLLIIFGGIGFIVWQDLFSYHRRHKLTLQTKLVLAMTAIMIFGGAFAFGLLEWNNPMTMGNMPVGEKILSCLFQSVTCRTAGFNSIDQAHLHDASKLVSTLLMFIGAAPGGTAGGVKVTTFATVILAVAAVLRGRDDPVLRGRRIEKKVVYRALAIVTLGMGILICTALIMAFNTPGRNGMVDSNLVDCLYESASAFGTVGLSDGVTAQLTAFGKAATILTMLIGRVGPVSMGSSLASRPGELSRREVLPEAKIVVG